MKSWKKHGGRWKPDPQLQALREAPNGYNWWEPGVRGFCPVTRLGERVSVATMAPQPVSGRRERLRRLATGVYKRIYFASAHGLQEEEAAVLF